MSNTTTNHATFGNNNMKTAIQLLLKRNDLFEILLKTYYYDYIEVQAYFDIYPTFGCWLENNEELGSLAA